MNVEKEREYHRQYMRKWRAAHPEYDREYMRKCRAAHPERREHDREYARKRRAENPERIRETSKKYRARLRETVLTLLGGRCARCGIDDPRVLQVDHINGGGTVEIKALHSIGVYRKALADPSPYQLLCANCNWIKRYENGEHPRRRNES